MACEPPRLHGIAQSRLSIRDLARKVIAEGIVAEISHSTVWRWLSEDAIRPWNYRSWMFPRDPDFAEKAGRVLDLYAGIWEGEPLQEGDFVLCSDEKTSIQARRRLHASEPSAAGRPARVEHEYERKGALVYLAAWDVQRAKLYGRCEPKSGIEPFGRLLEHVMSVEPYCCADRVFWILDNGSSHRGKACVDRLQEDWPTIVPVHLPVHASWLNQIEIYFSVVQRKVLMPNDFASVLELERTLLNFQKQYEEIATPFHWTFTRHDLEQLMAQVSTKHALRRAA